MPGEDLYFELISYFAGKIIKLSAILAYARMAGMLCLNHFIIHRIVTLDQYFCNKT
jgi:hypothetical protein